MTQKSLLDEFIEMYKGTPYEQVIKNFYAKVQFTDNEILASLAAPAPVLMWDKPEKEMPIEQWKNDYAADGAPPGVFSPNMSYDDRQRWKAQLVGTKVGYPRVEIRKSFGGVQALIIVSLGQGFKQQYKSMPEGANIQVSMNGAAPMTWDDLIDFNRAIQEAREVLESRQS